MLPYLVDLACDAISTLVLETVDTQVKAVRSRWNNCSVEQFDMLSGTTTKLAMFAVCTYEWNAWISMKFLAVQTLVGCPSCMIQFAESKTWQIRGVCLIWKVANVWICDVFSMLDGTIWNCLRYRPVHVDYLCPPVRRLGKHCVV